MPDWFPIPDLGLDKTPEKESIPPLIVNFWPIWSEVTSCMLFCCAITFQSSTLNFLAIEDNVSPFCTS